MATEHKRMRQLNATEAQWSTTNPVLLDGEIAFVTDLRRYKVGNGVDTWAQLEYWGGIDDAPPGGLNYGRRQDQWAATVDYNPIWAGDLDTVPEKYVQWLTLAAPITNGWEGVTAGDVLMDAYDPQTGVRIQVGYSHTSAGEAAPVTHTRVLRGTWTEWVTNTIFSQAPYAGNLDTFGGSASYLVEATLDVAVQGAWTGVREGSLVRHINIDANEAIQIGYDLTDDLANYSHAVWMRRKTSGAWGNWAKPGIEEANITDLNRMRWMGDWVDGSYVKNDVSREGLWLAVANTDTSDHIIPQFTDTEGFMSEILGSGLTLVDQTDADENIWFVGQRYEWPGSGYSYGYRFKCPEAIGAQQYEVWAITGQIQGQPRVEQLIGPFFSNTTDWIDIPSGEDFWLPGSDLTLLLVARPVTAINGLTADWDTKNKNGDPSDGEAWFQSSELELRVAHIDKDDIDYKASLESVLPGGTVSFSGRTWTITSVSPQTNHVRYNLTPQQGRPGENLYTITFEWGGQGLIQWERDDNYFDNTNDPEGVVIGLEGSDLNGLTETEHGYGVDIYVRETVASPDWDILAVTGEGGSNPSGDRSIVSIGTTFPIDPQADDLFYKTTGATGLYIYYNDGTSSQWVQTNGGAIVPDVLMGFNDPTGAASWRVDPYTYTLDCWGFVTADGSGNGQIVFPKSYTNDKAVTTITPIGAQGADVTAHVVSGSATANTVDFTTSVANGVVFYKTSGEWDGN